MITNIDIDEAIVAQAMKLSGARTKREVVDRALREMVARATRPSFRDLRGLGGIDPAYDPKAEGGVAEAAPAHRVEQERAPYGAKPPARPARRAKKA